MFSNAPAEGGDFFVEITGDADDDNAEGEDDNGEGDGEGEVGVQGGCVAGVSGKAAPKVTLGACKESAPTVPSLLKTLCVCKELFKTKKEAFHEGARRTQAAEAKALEGAAAGATVSDTFKCLEVAIADVESICVEGLQIIDRTLEAVDDAVFSLKPVSAIGLSPVRPNIHVLATLYRLPLSQ